MPIEFQRNQSFTEKRRASRSEVKVAATVRERGRSAFSAELCELSMVGCKIRGALIPAGDSPVWVRLPGLDNLEARVIWEENFVAGLAFEQPLHPSVEARFVPRRQGSATGAVVLKTIPRSGNDNDSMLSRREKIMAGLTASDLSPLEQRKRPTGHSLREMVVRRVTREANDRYEPRYTDAVANSPGALHVGGVEAELINVSPSGLKIAAELPEDIRIGQAVPVEFEGFEAYEGRVVWMSGHLAGINLPPRTIDLHDD